MTTQELIAKVLELDARRDLDFAQKVARLLFQEHYAPILARLLQKAIEQRDHYHAVCYRDLEPAIEDESLRMRNAELDRIAKGGE